VSEILPFLRATSRPPTNQIHSTRLRAAVDTTADGLEILAAIVSVYLMYQRYQDQRNGDGQAGVHLQGEGYANFLNVEVPPELEELRMLFQRVGALPALA
jgi:hypothetical protein